MSYLGEFRYVELAGRIKEYIKINYDTIRCGGGKLPSIAEFSKKFAAGKDNISNALQLLQDDGIVNIRKNCGCYIVCGVWEFLYSTSPDWHKMVRDSWYSDKSAIWCRDWSEKSFNFSIGALSDEFGYTPYVANAISEAAKIILNKKNLNSFCSQGLPSLRESLAAYLKKYKNIECTPDEIIITLGSSQNANVVAQSLMGFNARMIVNSPNPSAEMTALSSYGLTFHEFKVNGSCVDIDYLESLIKSARRCLMFFAPNVTYPTGITISEESRRETISLCHRYKVPILEADYFSDFEEDMPLPMKSLDDNGAIIHGGTLTGSLAIGLPINWLVVPKMLAWRFTEIVSQNNGAPATLPQIVLDVLLRNGSIEDYFAKARPIYRKRIKLMQELLKKYFTGYALWKDENICLYSWIEMLDENMKKIKECKDICLFTGEMFSKEYKNNLAMIHTILSEEELKKGMKLLGESLHRT